jgi:RNA polymerase sigma-70 factor (TIGR02960 family)
MTPVDQAEFETLVSPHRSELHAYCYRMLGSLSDADDALQEALLAAWRGLEGLEGRGALRAWLYRITTHACFRLIAERPRRVLPPEHAPPSQRTDVEPSVEGPLWLEPYPEPADARYELKESVELAFVAALQHLPATQRAALILAEVLGFSAAEIAELCAASVPAVNSALQRARATLGERMPSRTQQATLASLVAENQRALTSAFVDAWARADVNALVTLLTADVRFGMPPIPTWFDGREAVARFFTERVFRTPWRLAPLRASGQLAFACYQGPNFTLGALNVVTLRGSSIAEMMGFLHPSVHRYFSLPDR